MNVMKRRIGQVALAFSALFCSASFAGSVTCSGTVEAISFHASNTFMVRLSSMNTTVFFCSPDSTFSVVGTTYTTGPETCKALVALFIAARESGRTIQALYFDGDSVPATCDGWSNWSSANIRHFSY
jgi:hypothetical protein